MPLNTSKKCLFYSPAPTPKYERCEGKTDLIT